MSWFELDDTTGGGDGGDMIVRRADDLEPHMRLMLLTVAELLRAAG